MTRPDFLVIGHVAKDIVSEGWRLGGTVTYASVQAQRLGVRTAIVTRASSTLDWEQLLPDIAVRCALSDTITTFENRYRGRRRVQHVWSQAQPIGPEHVPREWRGTKMVLLGPLLGEVAIGLGRLFSGSLLGFCPQGWLREVRSDGVVIGRPWNEAASLRGGDIVVVSEEDLRGDDSALEMWVREVPIVVVTGGKGGARIYADGRWQHIPAFPHDEVDPTGAGDVFAAALMVSFQETGDLATAARFAAAAAGLSVGAPGIDGIATREQIERVLAEHLEVVLQ